MPDLSRPIVVSDDNADVMTLYRMILEKKGGFTNVIYTSDALEVLSICQSQEVALVISDISKPGIDGFEMLRRLRENPATQAVPVMFSTTRVDAISRQRAASLGVTDYLAKPFTASQLLERVNALLEQEGLL